MIRPSLFLCLVCAASLQSAPSPTDLAPQIPPPAHSQDKAAPLAQTALELAPDGVWTWFNDERALWHRGRLYAGYVTADGLPALSVYDPANAQRHHTRLGTERARQRDDHNNCSLTVLADGHLLAAYAKHGSAQEFYTRRSLVPEPLTEADWAPETVVTVGARNTYANTYRLAAESDRLLLFHRAINWNPTLSLSLDSGASWQPARQLIRAGRGSAKRPYVRYSSDNYDRIELLYTDGHPRDVDNSVYHLFYSAGAFHRSDGEQVRTLAELPLDHDAGERGTVVYPFDPAFGRGWVWDVERAPSGAPVCVFQTQRDAVTGPAWSDDRIYYHYARWTPAGWQRRLIAQAGRPLYEKEDDYGGGLTLDPRDPRIVYLSTNAARPFDLASLDDVPLNPDDRYELWRGITEDGGLTFTWTPVTQNSASDNFRPHATAVSDQPTSLLWITGRYVTYTNYTTRVVFLPAP